MDKRKSTSPKFSFRLEKNSSLNKNNEEIQQLQSNIFNSSDSSFESIGNNKKRLGSVIVFGGSNLNSNTIKKTSKQTTNRLEPINQVSGDIFNLNSLDTNEFSINNDAKFKEEKKLKEIAINSENLTKLDVNKEGVERLLDISQSSSVDNSSLSSKNSKNSKQEEKIEVKLNNSNEIEIKKSQKIKASKKDKKHRSKSKSKSEESKNTTDSSLERNKKKRSRSNSAKKKKKKRKKQKVSLIIKLKFKNCSIHFKINLF